MLRAMAELTRVATYRRTVRASADRVWENVHDWEHLPWLHRTSFSSIELRESGDWGWRARIGLQPEAPPRAIELELVLDSNAPRYVSRTLDGPGAGTEIWTEVRGRSDTATDISVEFLLPDVDPDAVDRLGEGMVALYTRLWDEDEDMMIHRAAGLTRGAATSTATESVELGPLAELRARLPLTVELAGKRFRIVEDDGELVAHSVVCPHMLGPLDAAAVEDGCVRCPWHGYRFDIRTGRNPDGQRLRLAGAPRVDVDEGGRVRLRP
jgi:nitrite reductase/ring-hydroxylating ferredoxin subunit